MLLNTGDENRIRRKLPLDGHRRKGKPAPVAPLYLAPKHKCPAHRASAPRNDDVMTAKKAPLKMFSGFLQAPFSNGTPRDCQVAPVPAAEALTSAACVDFVLPSARDVEKPGTLLRSASTGASVAHVEVPKPIAGRSVTRTPIA
ncbi:hypothetical protein HPB52_002820 [Rhipicephalus sanguineus]|uniref:Uncharacterized protein n=1 Tax=Rhipicephalus sanguineus TaxID=34632 RepID=A0A9D4T548_RHISA|nr:hypothetical protein HPB52_002820 [Rhipicephalus sanguineus]